MLEQNDEPGHEHDPEPDKKPEHDKCGPGIDPAVHRLVLQFLNDAVRPEDLMYGKPLTVHVHPAEAHGEPDHHRERQPFIEAAAAKRIMKFREERYPLGFRHWQELLEIPRFRLEILDGLIDWFGRRRRGQWTEFPQDIPQVGPGTISGVVHAALLKTGEVLFITADETTLLWNPEDSTASTWENPGNQPHTMPGGYSQLCGHHVQLSDPDGSLFSVGGGGYGPNALAKAAYIFNPVTKLWRRSANDMVNYKWYPTAASLGGEKVLVVSGRTATADIEIFDEGSETFSPITGDDRTFPNIYPGLHILPNNAIFYSRTGFGTAGGGPGGTSYDDDTINPAQLEGKRPAYLTLNGDQTVATWQKITTSPINRTKGMSVVLNSCTPPYVRILVVGGADASSNDTYEIFNASVLTPTASFDAWEPVPDGENRSLPSLVLLPDGNVFVCGGINANNSPCTQFDARTNTWSATANLPSVRQYHSVAVLLPSAKVMMAGWYNTKIDIYSPPYLFKGARPQITSAPNLVHHGATFTIESPQAASISRVVFVRPMAVTHQTDSEQRVIDILPLIHDPAHPGTVTLTAPDGGHPHPMAPRGHYMMFALNTDGVPSVARWIYLH